MSEHIWKTFDAVLKTAHLQRRRIEDLETRVTTLERLLRERSPESEVYAERPVLKLAEPEQVECERCNRFHSSELPCVTPADKAREIFGKEVTA